MSLQKTRNFFFENYSLKPFQRTLERFQATDSRHYAAQYVKVGQNP